MRNLSLQEELDLILANQFISGFPDNKKCIDWAISLMQRGYDSESLYILAGLDYYEWYNIEKYFECVCMDLNLNIETEESLLIKKYIKYTILDAINKKVDPEVSLGLLSNFYWKYYDKEEYSFFYFLSLEVDLAEYFYASNFSKEERDIYILDKLKEYLEDDENNYTT